uniref:Uncharacterized protein n=1 Tax=Heterorhabditis bacteriophora TaxID=37862 RepID=A0A1I7WIH0_HETBA
MPFSSSFSPFSRLHMSSFRPIQCIRNNEAAFRNNNFNKRVITEEYRKKTPCVFT